MKKKKADTVKSTEPQIFWDKKYYEDVGEKDSSGYYGYAYYYNIYAFKLPDNTLIRARIYTDTPQSASFFGFYEGDLHIPFEKKEMYTNQFIVNIILFVIEKENLNDISYFNQGYKSLDIKKLKTAKSENISFEKKKML